MTPLKTWKVLSFLALTIVSGLSQEGGLTQRQIVLDEMNRRPHDPWPRGDGHILLGEPGSPLAQKAYHEPGGSFSPSPGSFGMAVWVVNAQNEVTASSDTIPMEQIQQRYVWKEGQKLPVLSTHTPYYRCVWSYNDMGSWRFDLNRAGQGESGILLVFRSVGPAGGPIYSASWDQFRVLINDRWVITPESRPETAFAGDEQQTQWVSAMSGKQSATSSNGWAFVKLGFIGTNLAVTIRDTKPLFRSPLSYEKTVPQFRIRVPDPRFQDCLEAQVANLMMGYIGRQTGPGEPVNYPLAWERDGAYSLMAMAKSGNRQTAKELSVYFAENDFFGGFGAEGDAPGSAINALTEVALLLDDKSYYQWVWPHIQRKLLIIDEMMHATNDIDKHYIGPIVPYLRTDLKRRELIATKGEPGLVTGSMDLHFPAIYTTAVSYRGLRQAAKLARRLHQPEVAEQCAAKAATLKAGWMKYFGQDKYEEERNYMISVWPSWITDKSYQLFRDKFQAFHDRNWGQDGAPKERPLWTYFLFSQAHQWLFLERPEMTWMILEYFWKNQCSPGFYSFWEGNGEENSFHGWDNYRGWLKPKYVTPHYWTASELLLLQLDMLAYFDESGPEPQLVVGGGVPKTWLDKTFGIEDYRTAYGTVSWTYQNDSLTVKVKGAKGNFTVRPGPSFDQGTKLRVSRK